MALTLKSIRFTNYKAFKKAQSIELKPITVLLGKNNSGKSVIARLPLLLHDALTGGPGDAPLSLQVGGVDFGSAYSDFVYNNNPHGQVELGITLYDQKHDKTIQLDSILQHESDKRAFTITDQEIILDLLNFKVYWDDNQHRLVDIKEEFNQVEFEGLLPINLAMKDIFAFIRSYVLEEIHNKQKESLSSTESYLINYFTENIKSLASKGDKQQEDKTSSLIKNDTTINTLVLLLFIRFLVKNSIIPIKYLGPFRKEPERFYRIPGNAPQHLGNMGENAPLQLAMEINQRHKPLLEAVNHWYNNALDCELVLQDYGRVFSIAVKKAGSDIDHGVNIVDVGAGISQVLPIVMQQQQAKLAKEKTHCLNIIEQPELHLHPAAHGSLADLYIEGTKHGGQFLIETHSETLILRLRRRIAEGRLTPEDVALYWVDDQLPEQAIRKIEIDSQGNVSDWPKDVFSEDYKEAMAIRRAQKQHH